MNALENAKKMSREEVLDQIRNSGLQEYGLCAGPLADRIEAAKEECLEEGKEPGAAAALNNADTEKVLLSLLKTEPEKVLEGIAAAAYVMGAEKKYLYVPEDAAAQREGLMEELKDKAEAYGVEIIEGLVNVRERKGCLLMHMVTAAELANLLAGEAEEGVYVSVNGGALRKVPAEQKISELEGIGDTAGAKGFLIGYEYHGPEAADLTVGEANAENGVIRTVTDKDCIVSQTENVLMRSRKQSCGKCVFCREGLIQLQYMNKEITEGRGKAEYPELIKEIGEAMTFSAPCSMGLNSSRIALSALEKFESEYTAHIRKKKCPAGVCFSQETIYIDPKKCSGCGECMDVCPKDCIEGKAKYIHMIDGFDCDQCGKCIEVCEEEAIIKTSGKVPKLPNRLTKVGRFRR